MNYGVVLTGVGPMADPEKLRRAARKADDLGFHSLWLFQHVVFPAQVPASYGKIPFTPSTPFLEPVATLSYLAADTKRIRLGTGVLLLALYHPLLVAKALATLDVISGGRAILGVGLGWLAEEFEAFGIPFRERAGRVRESVEILRKIWAGGSLEHTGRYYSFAEVTSYPQPIQPGGPPIYFGAFVQAAQRRAAELGDGWLGTGGPVEKVAKTAARVREFARQRGKEQFTVAVSASPEITPEEAAQLGQAGADQINLSILSGEAAEIEARLEAAAKRLFS